MRQEFSKWFDWVAATASALLLILSFPNFEFWFLAWIGLVPLLIAIARRPSPGRALLLGWTTGTLFFYVTCYWLTYSMIHYGGVPTLVAYVLLLPAAIVVGLFPGLAMMLVAWAVKRWGDGGLLLAPVFWTALEWLRLEVTGQLWNALGYSQAFKPALIQPANWGGVYAVSFLIVLINSTIALIVLQRSARRIAVTCIVVVLATLVIVLSRYITVESFSSSGFQKPIRIVALQPNVPMTAIKTVAETKELLDRHLTLSTKALANAPRDGSVVNLVIWPESPMNFTYAQSREFQQLVASFTRENRTYLLFNSLEPAPGNGSYNSALLINEQGERISQYDKIRLMPFGEYVPLPQWLPGASLITGIVGEFTPGNEYTLMPVEMYRVGVFICIESAYPWAPRRMAQQRADLLINISNDGYLGPTAVMRQHLANVIFRAVENGRPVMRVTNSGLSAEIDHKGKINDLTGPFQTDVRVWTYQPSEVYTVYKEFGDWFVYICAAITALFVAATLVVQRRGSRILR